MNVKLVERAFQVNCLCLKNNLNNTFKIKFHLRIDFLDLLRFLRVCNEGRACELATKRLKTSMIDDKNLIFKN